MEIPKVDVFHLKSNLEEDDYASIEECLLSSDISWGITESIIKKIKSQSFKSDNWEDILVELLSNIIILFSLHLTYRFFPSLEKNLPTLIFGL